MREVQSAVRLAPANSGGNKMKLLNRVQYILGIGNPKTEPSWVVGVLTIASLAIAAAGVGVIPGANPVVAQEREGGRSAEAEAGPRKSAEAEAGPRRSAEGEGRRRSAEGDAGARRSAEGERGDVRDRDGEGSAAAGETLRGFRPQTDREAALLQMIVQLQREVAALRREVQARGHDGDAAARDGHESRERPVSRDGDAVAEGLDGFTLPENWQRTKEGRVFKAYDKNGDEIVSLDEWLAMTNGNISDARRAISTKHFNDAEPSGDGKFTPAEFIWWRQIGSRQAAERARQNRNREGSADARSLRDGERSKEVPRDGDRE